MRDQYDDRTYYQKLKYLPLEKYPMKQILNAVDNGIAKMKGNKKYQLKEIVELGDPGLWKKMGRYTSRCIGYTFAAIVGEKYSDALVIDDYDKKPYKYILVD